MNIEQSGLNVSDDATDPLRRRHEAKTNRQQPAADEVAQFQRLLGDRGPSQPAADGRQAQTTAFEDSQRFRLKYPAGEGMPMPTAPSLLAAGEVQAPEQPAAPTPIAELIESYVQQLLVSESSLNGPDGRVMLKLNAELLPDTELFLAKSVDGWVLQVHSRSADSLRVIADNTVALERRFAERRLGGIRVESVFERSR